MQARQVPSHDTPHHAEGAPAALRSPPWCSFCCSCADRAPDIVTANFNTGDVAVLLGNGDGTFLAARAFDTGEQPTAVAVLDADGDGVPDIVTANSDTDNVSLLLGKGDGTFGIEQRFGAGSRPLSVVVEDLNDDGLPDIATVNGLSGSVSVLLHR